MQSSAGRAPKEQSPNPRPVSFEVELDICRDSALISLSLYLILPLRANEYETREATTIAFVKFFICEICLVFLLFVL